MGHFRVNRSSRANEFFQALQIQCCSNLRNKNRFWIYFWKSIYKGSNFCLRGKSFQVLAMIIFLFRLFDCMFLNFLLWFCLCFGWHCSIDLVARQSFSVIFLKCISGLVLLCLFASSNRFLFRLTLTSWNLLFQWLTSLKKWILNSLMKL